MFLNVVCTGDHRWLLSEEVDLLPALLLPLAGPEQFDEEEVEELPLDLQYLPEDKSREPDPDIRTMLLEALLKVRPKLRYFTQYAGQRPTLVVLKWPYLVGCNRVRSYKQMCALRWM